MINFLQFLHHLYIFIILIKLNIFNLIIFLIFFTYLFKIIHSFLNLFKGTKFSYKSLIIIFFI